MPEVEGGSTFDGSTVEGSSLTRTPAPGNLLRLAATLLCHPDLARVGERALLGVWPAEWPAGRPAGRAAAFSRLEPRFYRPSPGGAAPPGAPLGDRQLSREPWLLLPAPDGLELDPAGCPHPLLLEGRRAAGRTPIARELLEGPGATLEIGDRAALLLHLVAEGEAAPVELAGAELAGAELVGASREIAQLRRQIARVGPAPWPVLLRGETGTGKELVARALHQASGRPGPFLAVNMAALPAELAAAELFGSRRGAFTGAGADRRGLCAAADRGTLFLDEIGEAPLELQAMLLRTLETGEILPIGSDKPQKVDLRFVAATDADLELAIEQGKFRAPLLHRLGGLQLQVPPLRARRDDIPRLFLHFLELELRQLGRGLETPAGEDTAGEKPWLTPALAAELCRHSWPGNVRELRNLARRHAAFGPAAPLDLAAGREPAAATLAAVPAAHEPAGRPRQPDQLERPEVLAALEASRHQIKTAAALLGLSRGALYAVLERLGLPSGAGRLGRGELEEALRLAGGDAVRAARSLGVSARAFSRRRTELEAAADEGAGTPPE